VTSGPPGPPSFTIVLPPTPAEPPDPLEALGPPEALGPVDVAAAPAPDEPLLAEAPEDPQPIELAQVARTKPRRSA